MLNPSLRPKHPCVFTPKRFRLVHDGKLKHQRSPFRYRDLTMDSPIRQLNRSGERNDIIYLGLEARDPLGMIEYCNGAAYRSPTFNHGRMYSQNFMDYGIQKGKTICKVVICWIRRWESCQHFITQALLSLWMPAKLDNGPYQRT
jgi:hypothetical protein